MRTFGERLGAMDIAATRMRREGRRGDVVPGRPRVRGDVELAPPHAKDELPRPE